MDEIRKQFEAWYSKVDIELAEDHNKEDVAAIWSDGFLAGQKAMREACRKLARDWPAPTSGRIPVEIANGIATLPIEGAK
jgi:hypothetical protein